MEQWKKLEFEYASRLRSVGSDERKDLYGLAYSEVAKHRVFRSSAPEDRTAGTSKTLVNLLLSILEPSDQVLEIGCGRGYTCMMLAPHIQSIIGTEVSEPSFLEARAILAERGITNASIVDVSATDLLDNFHNQRFDVALSIEVVEHLHPDDAKEHLRQVFALLKPGGKYIITMPNRLNGPHDIIREEYPDKKNALGFHLNESTYRDMIRTMRSIGFTSFRSFRSFRGRRIYIPTVVNVMSEKLFERFESFIASKFLTIQLIAWRP